MQDKKRFKLNIGLVVFMALFVYMLVNMISYFTRTHITFYEVVSGHVEDNINLMGIILRDEHTVAANGSGYINYFMNDGEKAASGSNIYMLSASAAYADNADSTSTDTASMTLTTEDYATLNALIFQYKSAYSNDNFNKVYDFKYQLNNDVSNIVSAYNISLAQKNTAGFQSVTASESGVISYTIDNYTGLTADNITDAVFNMADYKKTQQAGGAYIEQGDAAYRTVTDEDWSLVIKPDASQLKILTEKKRVNVTFTSDNISAYAGVSTFSADGNTYVRLDFSNYMVRYIGDRYLDIQINLSSMDGLKIPKSALTAKTFYRIPKEYLITDSASSDGIFYMLNSSNSVEGISPTVYASDEDYCYIAPSGIDEGTILTKGEEGSDTFTVGDTAELKGVYNINRGYAAFRLVNISYESGDYCIIEDNTAYGLSIYDHIILNSTGVKENQIIY